MGPFSASIRSIMVNRMDDTLEAKAFDGGQTVEGAIGAVPGISTSRNAYCARGTGTRQGSTLETT